jgi:hypothetical protein
VANPLQEQFAEVLLERISSDPHPSTTHMDMFESVAPPQQRVQYILLLLGRIEGEPNPSIPIMRRVQRLIMEFGT